jgi:DNA helicase-2/ATP-dependent DNA helicase PcrA
MGKNKKKDDKKFIPSLYQEKIFDFIENGIGNAVVSAVAGSGKTTTILKSLEIIPKNKEILYLAFNKDIVNSIKEKNSSIKNVDFKTVHGYGMSILNNQNKNISINNYKYSNMLRNIYNYLDNKNENVIDEYHFTEEQIEGLKNFKLNKSLVDGDDKYKFQKRIVELCNYSRIMLIKNEKELKKVAIEYDIDCFNGECRMALELVELGLHHDCVIDYTDMLFFPLKFDMECKKYDWVFIDECKDLNKAQRLLMLKTVKENSGRWLAVGDLNQAIYGFAGADVNSFKELISLPNTIELPLSVCYRCDKKIINFAKTIVKDIEFFDKNGDGIIDESASINDVLDGDMVLCRNTYPLVKLCFDYLKKGIKATIKGREICKSIIDMIVKSKTEDINELFDYLYSELEKTKNKIIKTHNLIEEQVEENETYIKQKENIEIIELISSESKSCSEIISKLDYIFSDSNKGGIQLSTIHKAKGLEFERVFIIHRESIPSKFAKTNWQIQQEQNLLYVAYTRAKKYLGFVNDFDAYKEKDKYDKSSGVKKILESKHVGYPGSHIRAKLKLLSKKMMDSAFGQEFLCTFLDENNNVFTKFGKIPKELNQENKIVDCYVIIKEHRTFNSEKQNQVSKILTVIDYEECRRKGKNFLYYPSS